MADADLKNNGSAKNGNTLTNAPLWQKSAAAILLGTAVLWLSFSYIFSPKITEIQNLKKNLKMIDNEIKILQGDNAIIKNGQDIRAILQKELEETLSKIPTEDEVPYLLEEFIAKVGRGINIEYKLLKPAETQSEKDYRKLPIRIELSGQYYDFNSYLIQLKELPATLRVDKLDIRRTKDSYRLDIALDISAFVLPGKPFKSREKNAAAPLYLKDPFTLPVLETPTSTTSKPKTNSDLKLKLEGFWQGKEKKAFINGQALGEGQTISGYTVQSISEKNVVLTRKGKKYILKLDN